MRVSRGPYLFHCAGARVLAIQMSFSNAFWFPFVLVGVLGCTLCLLLAIEISILRPIAGRGACAGVVAAASGGGAEENFEMQFIYFFYFFIFFIFFIGFW